MSLPRWVPVPLDSPGRWSSSRRPDSPFRLDSSAAYGLLVGLEGVAIGYAIASAVPAAGGALGDGTVAAVLGVWIAPVANALLILALLLVPDGHLPSRRWLPLAWFVVGSAALGVGHQPPGSGNARQWTAESIGACGHGRPLPTAAGASAVRCC